MPSDDEDAASNSSSGSPSIPTLPTPALGTYPFPPLYSPPPWTWPTPSAVGPPHNVFTYPSPSSPFPVPPLIASQPSSEDQFRRAFAADLFDGLFSPAPPGRRSRAKVKWPRDVTTEERLLVAFRVVHKLGFPTIGAFISSIVNEKCSKYPEVYQSVSAFLQSSEVDRRNHSRHIIDAIFYHPKSQNFDNHVPTSPHYFAIQQYSLPPSSRLSPPAKTISVVNTTRNDLEDWALKVILERVDKEAAGLLDPLLGFKLSRKASERTITWDTLLAWSLSDSQQLIATHAPVTFAILSTFAVNNRMRRLINKKVQENVLSDTSPDMPSSNSPAASSSEQVDAQLSEWHTFVAAQESERDGPVDADDPDGGEQDLTDDEDGTDPNIASIGRRDPWQAITVVILMLLYHRNRFALMFPIIFGVFLFTCNANRDIISTLSRIGLAISSKTILSTLHMLAADSSARLKVYGSFSDLVGPQFLLLFDNVNKQKKAWQTTLGHQNEMNNGTAATLIQLEDVPPGALQSAPLLEKICEKARNGLTVDEMMKDIDWPHIEGVGHSTVLRILLKYVPALASHKARVEEIFSKTHSKHPLRLRKSVIQPMRPSNIDESSTAGAGEVISNLVSAQLFVLPIRLFKWMIMLCGDQLSIDRMRKLKRYLWKTDSPFERREWVLPVIQLWHLKWNWQKCIFRLHWNAQAGKGVYGLHYDCIRLSRIFNATKCDFYPAHHILEDRFEALILEAIRIICEEKTSIVTLPDVPLISTVQSYFAPGGKLHLCVYEELVDIAQKTYNRYLCNAASSDARGHYPRDPAIYGPHWEPPCPTPDDLAGSLDEDGEDDQRSSLPSQNPAKRSRTRVAAQPARNFLSEGDQDMETLTNFMRMTFWYMEICAATSEGDIGHVFEIIKLLRFSFWGAGSTNYGNELLELACNFLYEFSDDLKMAVLNNYLVNPSGRKGHWFELDLLQEHFNFWIKRLFNTKSHDFDSKHLAEAVGLNISGISSLRERFPGLFGLTKNGHTHTKASTVHDINFLGIHYRQHDLLRWIKGRSQLYKVANEFYAGKNVLLRGQLATFLTRTTCDGSVQDDTVEVDAEDVNISAGHGNASVEISDTPSNPITIFEGALSMTEFITGE